MWSTKKPATDASNPIALNANLHECLAKNGLHGGTTAAFDQGKASQQNAEVSFCCMWPCEKLDNRAGIACKEIRMLCDTGISCTISSAADRRPGKW